HTLIAGTLWRARPSAACRKLHCGSTQIWLTERRERDGMGLSLPFQGRDHRSSATLLRSTPISGTSTSTTSPRLSQRGGVKRAPAPVGVPVAIMSPGLSVVKVLI